MRKRSVSYEQAVYGSFSFWDRGYGILARSANCRPEWLTALKTACQRYGERPKDGPDPRGYFLTSLDDGTRIIVGVFCGGSDDRGRPGALVFHALFVAARPYRKAGYQPFAFANALRGDWSVDHVDAELPAGLLTIDRLAPPPPGSESLADEIRKAITQGRRVVVASDEPIHGLARRVWLGLKERVRSRASLATFAYDTGNDFDLAAIPEQRALALAQANDAAYLVVRPEPRDVAPAGSSSACDSTDAGRTPSADRLQPRPRSLLERLSPPLFLSRVFRSIVPPLVLVATLGCARGFDVTPEAIAKAQSTWDAAGIDDYDLELTISSPPGHYVSSVRGGKVRSIESIRPDGERIAVRPGDPRFYSVDGLFRNMTEELAQRKSETPFGQPKGSTVVMKFDPDPQLGYPRSYQRDVLGSNRGTAIDVVRLAPIRSSN